MSSYLGHVIAIAVFDFESNQSVPLRYIFTARSVAYIARYCRGKLSVGLSVRPSVRPSVTLVDCDDMRWNSSKIISRMIISDTYKALDQLNSKY